MPVVALQFNNGIVNFDKVNYYIFPIDPAQPEVLIFLNKTAMGSASNGDAKMLGLMLNHRTKTAEEDKSDYGWDFREWIYPSN